MPRNSKSTVRSSPDASEEKVQKSRARKDSFPIVGIGASAGGLEAMTQLLRSYPVGTGMAMVLIQHLDPTHESGLTSILARSTSMPVLEARNNMRLQPNHLYIIPPNKLMGTSGGRLKLSPRGGGDTFLTIDHFLRSLAESQGNLAVGVILSGNGSDGRQGLLAIKAAGGITFAQDEATAKYPAMPGSAISAGCIDFVLPPEKIALELARLAGHPYIAPKSAKEEEIPSEQKVLEDILGILRQRTGVDFVHYKHATLRRRIQRRMVLHKLESLKDYAEYLRSHMGEVKDLYDDILIHVTGFFRDPGVYNVLKKKVFPRLLKHKPANEGVRIWVPGCSTGEEVFSIAISLTEFLVDHKMHNPVQIFGTDINEKALERARAGVYPENIRADVAAERLRRFFVKAEGGYRVNKSVREICIFARQNVVVDPPFSNIDLISCRNVLIYLGPALQRKVMPLFHYALRASGFLLLGASETVSGFVDLFTLYDRKFKVYTRRAARVRPAMAFGPRVPETMTEAGPVPPMVVEPLLSDVQRNADRILLTHFSPAGVTINKSMEVVHFRGRTGQFLEHAHGEASLNLLKMARESLVLDLRTAVTKAVRHNARVRKEGVRVKQNGTSFLVDLEVIPFTVPPSSERYYLVLFEPAMSPEGGRPPKKTAEKVRQGARVPDNAELGRVREELAATRESLQAIIEEQEATNEELRSANEEIMSSNEELQSTNEELETAKEELQSTNEELTTLNDELESRNAELEQVNNDFHNLLASVNIPVLILGQDLRIRRFTGMAEKAFNLIPGDVGRPITDINLPISIPDLPKLVLDVIDSLTPKEFEVKCTRGHWWSVRVRPYKTSDNRIDGAVIAAFEIDTLKLSVQQMVQSRKFAESLVQTIRHPVLVLDGDLTVQFVNRAFCQLFHLSEEVVQSHRIYTIAEHGWDVPKLRVLLEDMLPHNAAITDYEIEHDFPFIGRKVLRVNALRLAYNGEKDHVIVLSIESVSEGATMS